MDGWQGGEAGDAGKASVRTKIFEKERIGEPVDSVDNGDNSEVLKEIIWCDHLAVVPMPVKGSTIPHVFIHEGPVYLVVEQNVVKMVCPRCWLVSQGHQPTFFTGDVRH